MSRTDQSLTMALSQGSLDMAINSFTAPNTIPSNAMLWDDGSAMQWDDNSYMTWD